MDGAKAHVRADQWFFNSSNSIWVSYNATSPNPNPYEVKFEVKTNANTLSDNSHPKTWVGDDGGC